MTDLHDGILSRPPRRRRKSRGAVRRDEAVFAPIGPAPAIIATADAARTPCPSNTEAPPAPIH